MTWAAGLSLALVLGPASIVCPTKSFAGDLKAAKYPAVPLQIAVDRSAIVGRVLVKSSRKAKSADGMISCGHLFRATMIESFKGRLGEFEFFSDRNLLAGDSQSHALVFISRRDIQDSLRLLASIAGALTDEQLKNINCRLNSEFYLPTGANLFVPIVPRATKSLGGMWLESSRSIVWCASDNPMSESFVRHRAPPFEEMDLIDWNDARVLLRDATSWYRGLMPVRIYECP